MIHLSNVILFVASDGGVNRIYTVKPDGTGLAPITGAGTGWDWAVATPDGSQILAYKSSPGLVAMAADGSSQRTITNLNTNWRHDPVTFSPDGSQFVATYSAAPGFFPLGVQIVNFDNSGHTDIALADWGGGNNPIAYWSPDGGKLAFPSSPGGLYDGVSVCNVDGSGEVTVLAGTSATQYDVYGWYADGVHLLVNATGQSGADPIDVLKTDGATSVVLYSDPTEADFGDWCQALSPDETKVVLFDDASGGLSILAGGVVSGLVTPPPTVNVSFVQWVPPYVPTSGQIHAGRGAQGILRLGRGLR